MWRAWWSLKRMRWDWPVSIGIEVSTACNFRCHYCPQSVEPQKQNVISDHLWNVFLYRIKEMGWRGEVVPVFFNELSIVAHSERYVADLVAIGARVCIPTNGSKPEVIKQWIEAGVHHVLVTEHPPFKAEWRERLGPVAAKYPHKITVMRLGEQDINDRAGKVNVLGRPMPYCNLTYGLIININGQATLCCNDYKKENCYGDIRTDSLLNIWRSFRKVRNRAQSSIAAVELCKTCLTP